jgi:hypothetical protein
LAGTEVVVDLATPEEIRPLAISLLSAVDLVAVVGLHTADQEEMLAVLTGVNLKVSQVRQLLELHLMVRTSLPTATPVESHIPMELPVTVSLLAAVAVAVHLQLAATPLNRAMSIQELAELAAKELQTHGEAEVTLSTDLVVEDKAEVLRASEAPMQERAVERMLQETLALMQ